MIMAISVMFVCGLLLIAAFKATGGDVHLTRKENAQKQAYYAAQAGVQEYEYHLQANPDYWETCEAPAKEVQESSQEHAEEHYEIKLLTASTSKGATECSTSNPYGTMIQSSGAEANTFRIDSIGTAGKKGTPDYEKREIIATYRVVGFLDYAYFTQYEDGDPKYYSSVPSWCAKEYRPERKKEEEKTGQECKNIEFASQDGIAGPVHTDDGVLICGSVTFGRENHNPPDVVEFNHGWEEACGSTSPKFNTATKKYSVGTELLPPEGDQSLGTYVKEAPGGLEFEGTTHLELAGSKIYLLKGTEKIPYSWPENGLVYVRASKTATCTYRYSPEGESDTAKEELEEAGCGSVYVNGTYSKPITVAAQEDVVVNGNILPTGLTKGEEPTGTVTAGLIAGGSVRIYHPISGTNNGQNSGCTASNATGYQQEPWIYAAILSTDHSFTVDNYNCGAKMGNLNVYGAIAQKYRGIVGVVGSTGYTKDYKYDQRLAVDEPPYFLNPINAGWEVSRETSPGGPT